MQSKSMFFEHFWVCVKAVLGRVWWHCSVSNSKCQMKKVWPQILHWYTPTELAKRMGFYHSCQAVVGMMSGALQVAITNTLDGSHGLAGWRWASPNQIDVCNWFEAVGCLWSMPSSQWSGACSASSWSPIYLIVPTQDPSGSRKHTLVWPWRGLSDTTVQNRRRWLGQVLSIQFLSF